jgi:hypothetical protein
MASSVAGVEAGGVCHVMGRFSASASRTTSACLVVEVSGAAFDA